MLIRYILATVVFVFAGQARAAEEAKVFSIEDFEEDETCGGSDHGGHHTICGKWFETLTDDSGWYNAGGYYDYPVNVSMFLDPYYEDWARDWVYLDSADAALLCTHGQDVGYYRGQMYGSASQWDWKCFARQDRMLLGYDLEVLNIFSCHSLDDNLVNAWKSSFAGLHHYGGIHGTAISATETLNGIESYVVDALNGTFSLGAAAGTRNPSPRKRS